MAQPEKAATGDGAGAKARDKRRTRIGVVVSDARNKTIAVRIDRLIKHPKYGKYMRRCSTLHAHDEKGEAANGDIVEVMACRRISKTKSWRLIKVLRKAVEV